MQLLFYMLGIFYILSQLNLVTKWYVWVILGSYFLLKGVISVYVSITYWLRNHKR